MEKWYGGWHERFWNYVNHLDKTHRPHHQTLYGELYNRTYGWLDEIVLTILGLICIAALITLLVVRERMAKACSKRKKEQVNKEVFMNRQNGATAQRVPAGGAGPASYSINVNDPLADAAAVQEAFQQGEEYGNIALDILRQKTQQTVQVVNLTKTRIDAQKALSDSVYNAQKVDEERQLAKIRAQYEVAEMKLKLQALEATRDAAIAAAERTPLSVAGSGFTKHVSDKEIMKLATDLLVEVRKARDAGRDAAAVIDEEVTKLQGRHDPLIVREVLAKFQAYQNAL